MMREKTKNSIRISIFWIISLGMLEVFAHPWTIFCSILHWLFLPTNSYELLSDPRLYFAILLGFTLLFLLRKRKFIPSAILGLLFPVYSPVVFIWVEVDLYKRKKWLLFCYIITAYITLLGSGYYWLNNSPIYKF